MPRKRQSVNRLLSLVEKVSLIFGYISGGFAFLMMVIIGYDVVMRHIFNDPTIWADEVSCYLLVGITFLGAAYTLTMGGHIHVETLVLRLKPKIRQRLEFVTDVLSLVFLVVLARQAYWLVKDSYVSVTISATLLRTPLYLPQLLLAIGLTWLCLQLLVHILRRTVELQVQNGEQKLASEETEQEKGSGE
ncbi:MAG: TRAP transporter small permease [Desulfobacteraceae bacterium]|nr:TRAP transporter small permease [Desulfobacteraceae bacterium]